MAMPATVPEIVAEFVGTYLLVFTVGCNVLSGSPVWAGVSIACALTVMIYALGGSSGANFNPAVSLALGMAGKMEWAEVGTYMAVQLVAGIAAAFSYVGMFGMHKSFNLGPTPGHNWWQACLCETIYTFMLCFVVLNVAASKAHAGKNQFFGLAIGFVIVAGGYSGGHISGGCFNPAVAFGIDVSSFKLGVKWCFVYTAFEIIGAALAAGLYRVCRPDDFQDEEISDYPLYSKVCSEFLGTYILVLTVGLNVLGSSPAGAFSIAASLMCMIYALGSCSGANFNPAVSFALLINKTLDTATAGAYMGAQIAGGIAAAFTYSAIYSGKAFPLGPGAGYTTQQACTAELAFTFVLCLVVLCAAVHPTTKTANFFGLAIGACVTVGGNAIGAISGGSLNPAVSFGIASAAVPKHGAGNLMVAVIYTLFEFIGAAVAAGVVMQTHASGEAKDIEA